MRYNNEKINNSTDYYTVPKHLKQLMAECVLYKYKGLGLPQIPSDYTSGRSIMGRSWN